MPMTSNQFRWLTCEFFSGQLQKPGNSASLWPFWGWWVFNRDLNWFRLEGPPIKTEGSSLVTATESPARWGPLTTISGFIPSYTHLQPWLNRVCWGYNYLTTRGAPSCGMTYEKWLQMRGQGWLPQMDGNLRATYPNAPKTPRNESLNLPLLRNTMVFNNPLIRSAIAWEIPVAFFGGEWGPLDSHDRYRALNNRYGAMLQGFALRGCFGLGTTSISMDHTWTGGLSGLPYRIHESMYDIFTYVDLVDFKGNVGTYTVPMDPMGTMIWYI